MTVALPREKVRTRLSDAASGLLYLSPSIILFGVFLVYPLLRTIYLSFFRTDTQGTPLDFVGVGHYSTLFTSAAFWQSIQATVGFVLLTVPLTILIALGLALLANEKLKGIGIFRTAFSATSFDCICLMPIWTVRACSVFVTRSGHKYIFQVVKKLYTDNVTSGVFDTGKTTFQKNRKRLIPAIWDASYISYGIVLNCCRSKNVPNASAKNGTDSPQTLFSQPSDWIVKKFGTIVASHGTIIVARKSMKMSPFPLKSIKTNANAARLDKTTCPTITRTATTKLLSKYVIIGIRSNAAT